MADLQRERELKFDIDELWVPPRFDDLPGVDHVDIVPVHVESTYYDTTDRRLLAARLTLRRRTGDTDTGWQLKVPDGDARVEHRLPLTPGRGVPAELRDTLRGVRGRAALAPIAALVVEREQHRLLDADGELLVEVAVDAVTATRPGDRSAVVRWREVEAELGTGSEKLLRKVARGIRDSGARPAAGPSKLARALGVDAGPDRVPDTLAGLISAYLGQQSQQLVSSDLALREGQLPVHDTRVAIRRYRSVLRELGPVLEHDRAAALDTELAWYAELLGAVRDAHVLREWFDEHTAELPPALDPVAVRAALAAALDAEEADAVDAVRAALRSRRYLALLAELHSWRSAMPISAAEPAARVRRYLRRADRRADKRRRHAAAADADAAMHRARKAAKRARYLGELAEPVLGRAAREVTKRNKRVQTELGARQDAVVASQFLLGRTDQAHAFAFGVLYELARRDAER